MQTRAVTRSVNVNTQSKCIVVGGVQFKVKGVCVIERASSW